MRRIQIMVLILFMAIQINAQIPRDKQLHAFGGAVISAWAGAAVYSLNINKNASIALGFGVACLIGAGKELYDRQNGGSVELNDFLFTAAGAAISSITLKIVLKPPEKWKKRIR